MLFINETGVLGTIISAGTTNLTGSVVASLFLILIFIIIMCMMFQIPIELIAVILLPFILGVCAFYGNFIIPVVVIIIFVSAIIAKNFLFR